MKDADETIKRFAKFIDITDIVCDRFITLMREK